MPKFISRADLFSVYTKTCDWDQLALKLTIVRKQYMSRRATNKRLASRMWLASGTLPTVATDGCIEATSQHNNINNQYGYPASLGLHNYKTYPTSSL